MGFSITWTENFQMFKLGLEKTRGTRDQIANIHWINRKQGNSRKTSTSVSSTILKPLTVCIITNCGKLLKRWECQTILFVSWETCMWVKKQQLEPCMEQRTGSRSRKKYEKAVYCLPVYLTSMQSTLCEMPGWITHNMELRLPREISTTSDIQIIPF